MKLIHTIEDLQRNLTEARAKGEKIGLVPTMGALHEGHASLVRRCVAENDVTVVSVFLNPTQFNDKKDLEKYPRTLDADCALLEAWGLISSSRRLWKRCIRNRIAGNSAIRRWIR